MASEPDAELVQFYLKMGMSEEEAKSAALKGKDAEGSDDGDFEGEEAAVFQAAVITDMGEEGGDEVGEADLEGDLKGVVFQTATMDAPQTAQVVEEIVIPVRSKPIGTEELRFGFYELQGNRKTMEDAHCFVSDMKDAPQGEFPWHGYFSIFDGHGGSSCSQFAASQLYTHLITHPCFASEPVTALKGAFYITDREWLMRAESSSENDGCTALVTYIKGKTLYVANVGDSEGVLCRGGQAKLLTVCHNPTKNPAEIERVKAAGGSVVDGRLSHPQMKGRIFSIGVSKAIGDVTFKSELFTGGAPSGLTSEPDVCTLLLQDEDQFLILACDGVWDVLGYQDACDLVNRRLAVGLTANDIAKAVAERAFQLGSPDNITACVILF